MINPLQEDNVEVNLVPSNEENKTIPINMFVFLKKYENPYN